jgi:hypothetical protein
MTALSKGSLCNCSMIIHPDRAGPKKNASTTKKEVGNVMTALITTAVRTSLRDRFEMIRTQVAENAFQARSTSPHYPELAGQPHGPVRSRIAPSSIRQIAHKRRLLTVRRRKVDQPSLEHSDLKSSAQLPGNASNTSFEPPTSPSPEWNSNIPLPEPHLLPSNVNVDALYSRDAPRRGYI